MSRYHVTIDPSLCSGYGECVRLAPELFELDDFGVAAVRAGETENPAVVDAARACPMAAITVHDQAGRQAA